MELVEILLDSQHGVYWLGLTNLAVCSTKYSAYDDGKFFKKARVTKLDMRQRLVFVCKYIVNARPSRGNLKQVYNFLAGQSLLT
ncbi:hypothetical protein R6Q59_016443 [Mikania micrantha]